MTEFEAGPKLDARVHELIARPPDPARCVVCGWRYAASIEEGCTSESCSQRPLFKQQIPSYSTDPGAADNAVREASARWQGKYYWGFFQIVGFGWRADISELRNDHQLCEAEGETLPLAICRAVLRAAKKGALK